jgi:hypothetical protein
VSGQTNPGGRNDNVVALGTTGIITLDKEYYMVTRLKVSV